MPLFNFKKKKKEEMPDFSEKLPTLSSTQKKPVIDIPNFRDKIEMPKYESDLGSIKKAMEHPVEFKPVTGIPTREKKFKMVSKPIPKPEPVMHHHSENGKPIFVRIENYKGAVRALESIKDKLDNANDALDKLERLKEDEEREISAWRNNIEKLKDKLMFIDEKLFEV